MVGRFDNIHPELTCDHAHRILSTPVDQLESQSDLYMAASHLINCPGARTEQALMNVLKSSSCAQAVAIAKRKCVEVLARLNCSVAINVIGQCLDSTDIYLVENSVWALQQLNCDDPSLISRMLDLLKDQGQNQRVLIQCLAHLKIQQAVDSIHTFQESEIPGVRGAAISAVAQLTNDASNTFKIVEQLTLPNQMDRQCAVQDLIDAGASDFLPSIASAPISPAFRMRALRQILDSSDLGLLDSKFLSLIDTVLIDDPSHINIVHEYDQQPGFDFLLGDLFNTDFSRCYLALMGLRECPSKDLWPLIEETWEREAHNDYGANYFFIHLLGSRSDWPLPAFDHVLKIIKESIVNRRPQFRKSRAAAIQAFQNLCPDLFIDAFPDFLAENLDPPWDCRYATVMCIDRNSGVDKLVKEEIFNRFIGDSDSFVRARAVKSLANSTD